MHMSTNIYLAVYIFSFDTWFVKKNVKHIYSNTAYLQQYFIMQAELNGKEMPET